MGTESPGKTPLKTRGNASSSTGKKPIYIPSPKHAPGGYGSPNPIKDKKTGQRLLETGVKEGKQIYNVTSEGKIVKFQPDNTPKNGFHSYEVTEKKDIPTDVLKAFFNLGKISASDYKKYIKSKKKGKK